MAQKRQWHNIHENIKQWNWKDIILFFCVVPAVLIVVFNLPAQIRNDYFTLYPSNLLSPSLLLYDYNHADVNHIESNLFGYIITVVMLFYIETDKQRFYKNMVVLFLFVPPVVGIISAQFLPNMASVGFSVTLAGMMGYLTYALYQYVKKASSIQLSCNLAIILFLLTVIVSNVVIESNAEIFLAIILLILFDRNEYLGVIRYIFSLLKEMKYVNPFELILHPLCIISILIFSISALSNLIPKKIIIENGIIGIQSHYFAYVIGLFLPVTSEVIKEFSNLLIEKREKNA